MIGYRFYRPIPIRDYDNLRVTAHILEDILNCVFQKLLIPRWYEDG
jgi:hypothetical protein